MHPYPSLLNAALTAGMALVAGGTPAAVVRLAVAMALLQFSIGALNDVRDARQDAGHKARKPIPRGLVGERAARAVTLVTLGGGLLLAAVSGPAALLVAALGVGIGYLYDLWLKATWASWLPFCLGIPLVPVFGYMGVAGSLPAPAGLVVPLAALAGAGIAIGNALADLERDTAAGIASVATRLGAGRAWLVAVVLEVGVVLMAWITAALLAGPAGVPPTGALALALGSLWVAAGGWIGRAAASPGRREVAWEVGAAGLGLVGLGWLLAVRVAGPIAGQ